MNIFLISLFITSITAAANGYGKFPMYPSLANADPNTDLYSKVIGTVVSRPPCPLFIIKFLSHIF